MTQNEVKAPLSNSGLTINQEAVGTMEPMNTEDSIENEYTWFSGRDGGINQRDPFIYSEKSCTNPPTEIDIERVKSQYSPATFFSYWIAKI